MASAILIEDDARIARLLLLELEREGWEAQWHRTGREGLEAIGTVPPDIVLLDLMLPDLDGIVVCQSIRQYTHVPLLMLTARDAVVDRVQGLDAGADDYLVKPFAMPELLARMRALTRRIRDTPETDDDWLVVGRLRLSDRRHEVQLCERTVDLTNREFSLLRYFMQNLGVVVTRDMILERVWGWGYRGSSAVVDVYMGYLRHKVDWNKAGVNLSTIRGVGYVLRPGVL